jgi:hypothetical protein
MILFADADAAEPTLPTSTFAVPPAAISSTLEDVGD